MAASPSKKPRPKRPAAPRRKASPAPSRRPARRFPAVAALALGAALGAAAVLWWLWPEPRSEGARAVRKPKPAAVKERARPEAPAKPRETPREKPARPAPVRADLGEAISETARDLGYAARPLAWSDASPPAATLRFPDDAARAMGRRVLAAELGRRGLSVDGPESAPSGEALALTVRRGEEARRLLLATPRPRGPALALVIDDVGNDRAAARRIMALGLPITYAVLPFTPHGKELAADARASGGQAILHLPMEPKEYPAENPGPGALLGRMTEGELRAALDRALDWIGPVEGVNNHMGSRLTESRERMIPVARELKARGLFFLDSRTSPGSVAAEAAREAGVPTLERQVFLDDSRDPAAIRRQLDEALAQAEKRGRAGAIAIGHPYKETAEVLAEYAPRLREGPVRPVLLRELLARAAEGES